MKPSTIIRAAALAAACALGSAAVWAQGVPAAASKIGVINARGAIANSAEGKQAQAELQSQFASRQAELENLNKQINDIRQRLQSTEGKLSPEEQDRLTRQGQRLTTQLERKNQEYQDDLNNAMGEITERIGRKLVDVLDRYARENGYVVVLNTSEQGTPTILYAANTIDLTQDVIRLYDQAYPVKSSAAPAAPKPAAPKPAVQQPPAQKPPVQKPPQ